MAREIHQQVREHHDTRVPGQNVGSAMGPDNRRTGDEPQPFDYRDSLTGHAHLVVHPRLRNEVKQCAIRQRDSTLAAQKLKRNSFIATRNSRGHEEADCCQDIMFVTERILFTVASCVYRVPTSDELG
jgi:hypothetical protein